MRRARSERGSSFCTYPAASSSSSPLTNRGRLAAELAAAASGGGRRRGRQVRRAADNSNGRRRVAAAARTSARRTRSSPLYARTTSAPRSSRVRRTAMFVALRPGAASPPQRAHRVCCLRRATPHRAPATLIGAIGACSSARPPAAARRLPRPPKTIRPAAAGLTPPAGPAARMPAVRTGPATWQLPTGGGPRGRLPQSVLSPS